MDQKRESSLVPLLTPAAVAITVAALVLRWCVSGGQASAGINFFVHAIVLSAALVWLAAGAVRGTWTFRSAGPAVPLAIFGVLAIVSILRASYKLPALEHAFAYVSLGVLYLLVLNLFGTRRHLLLTMILGFVAVVCVYSLLQYFVIFDEVRKSAEGQAFAARGDEFSARLMGNEVWGTFFYANSLAGFLALALPILAGLIVDLRERISRIFAIAIGALAVGALYLTGSKGGWVAAGAGLGLFAALAATRTRPGLRKGVWIAAGAGTALVIALMIAGPLSPSKVGGDSMRLRGVYWKSALEITKTSPVLGVGLDNYQDHYTEFKGITQQETRKAHNDYLQVLAEMGVLGLLALLGFVGWTISHGVKAPHAEPVALDPGKHEALILGIAGFAAIALAWKLTGVFDEPLYLLAVGAAWVLVTALAHKGLTESAGGSLDHVRLGAIAGFVAMALHMTVDFDLYEFGLPVAWIIAAALVSLLAGRVPAVTADRTPAALGSLLIVLLLGPVLWKLGDLLEADTKMRDAGIKVDEALRMEGGAAAQDREAAQLMEESKRFAEANDIDKARKAQSEARLKASQAEEARAKAAAGLTDALKMYEECEHLNFLDAEAYFRHAELCELLWDRMRRDERNQDQLAVYESVAIQALENATRVRPRFAAAYMKMGTLFWSFAEHYRHSKRQSDQAKVPALLEDAARLFRKTVTLYPTQSHTRYWLARSVDLLGRDAEARAEYAEAMRLSDLAAPERLVRLQLWPMQKARCLLRLDRGDEAKALLRGHFRARYGNSRAIETMLGSEGALLRQDLGFEYDEFMKPVVDGVLRQLLAESRP